MTAEAELAATRLMSEVKRLTERPPRRKIMGLQILGCHGGEAGEDGCHQADRATHDRGR